MDHIELRFNISPLQPARDILIAELSELGYEAFEEDEEGLKAYIANELFNIQDINNLYVVKDRNLSITFSHQKIPDTNWNALWEESYDSMKIDDRLRVRASFHASSTEFDYEILIDPRMSFGTGHHGTTRLMLRKALEMELAGLNVLDMGCGTAVIAILVKMKEAARVLAIDIDENAVDNARENVDLNHVEIDVQKGTSTQLEGLHFNVIFANINRNVLLADMGMYARALDSGGALLLSGFYEQDVPVLKEKAKACGMEFDSMKKEAEWCLLEFKK